jgi:hypothetical protein
VPEASSFRVDLPASRRAGQLRAAARLVTVAAAAACAVAALLAPSAARIVAALAAGGATLLTFAPGRSTAGRTLAVDADGRIGVDGAEQAAVVRYCGRHLVCLGTSGGLLAIWPDSMSRANWRRLLVACRWQSRPPGHGRQMPSGLRTK